MLSVCLLYINTTISCPFNQMYTNICIICACYRNHVKEDFKRFHSPHSRDGSCCRPNHYLVAEWNCRGKEQRRGWRRCRDLRRWRNWRWRSNERRCRWRRRSLGGKDWRIANGWLCFAGKILADGEYSGSICGGVPQGWTDIRWSSDGRHIGVRQFWCFGRRYRAVRAPVGPSRRWNSPLCLPIGLAEKSLFFVIL